VPTRLPDGDPEVGVARLITDARAGHKAALGRLISLTENATTARLLARVLARDPDTQRAFVIGLTGAPGAGKSTLVSAYIQALRSAEQRVAVLAIDPSSPISGGALLGDRARMRVHSTDPEVFIRSMSSRGQLGGLSRAAPQALNVLEAAGFDTVIIETVGVGQSEVDVMSAVDSVVVVSAPGNGDELQAQKAGLLEIADIYVVNKSDLPGSAALARQLRQTAAMAQAGAPAGSWRRPVVLSVASADDIVDLVGAIDAHHDHLRTSGALVQRRRAWAASALRDQVFDTVRDWTDNPVGRSAIATQTKRVRRGEIDGPSAVAELLGLVKMDIDANEGVADRPSLPMQGRPSDRPVR
jgi:LAO/AO transport system kinase